jgi:hypothetical protein
MCQPRVQARQQKRLKGWTLDQLKEALRPGIPKLEKLFGWVLVLAGLFFAYVYMFNPGAFFPGVTISTYSEEFGLYSTGVRILGAVLGILVALLLNSAALLAIMLATRIFIELGDVVVGLVINGAPDANTFTLTILAAIELAVMIRLIRVVRLRTSTGRG